MYDIYELSASGGERSERFTAYRQAAEERKPVFGYNPMTREPVIDTIRELINLDAEAIASETANETAVKIGLELDATMHLSVATPGMWTDRLGTEVEHRLKAVDPTGILIWYDDEITVKQIRDEAIGQTVRLKAISDRQGRPAATLEEAVTQEGTALALAGAVGAFHQRAADILTSRSDDPSLATMVAFLYGDNDASAMGYTPIGLDNRTGYSHAIAIHS